MRSWKANVYVLKCFLVMDLALAGWAWNSRHLQNRVELRKNANCSCKLRTLYLSQLATGASSGRENHPWMQWQGRDLVVPCKEGDPDRGDVGSWSWWMKWRAILGTPVGQNATDRTMAQSNWGLKLNGLTMINDQFGSIWRFHESDFMRRDGTCWLHFPHDQLGRRRRWTLLAESQQGERHRAFLDHPLEGGMFHHEVLA